MAQYIEITKVWNGTKYCCPVCGSEVFDDNGEPTGRPCKHVLFSWIDAVGDYYNPALEIQRLIQQWEETDEFGPSPSDDEFLKLLPENSVLFALTEHGMACGPVSITVVHGIRFPSDDERCPDSAN